MDRLTQNPSIGAALGSPGLPQPEIVSPTFLSAEPSPFFSGARTPPERSGTNKRKLTLLALLDELTALRDEEQERDKEINYGPAADERLSSEIEGVERFRLFDERIHRLDLKLQAFANAVRQLGSSVGLLNAAYHLRARLTQIQYLFRENAAEQFDDVTHGPNNGTKPYSARKRAKVRKSRNLMARPVMFWTDDIEKLPQEMEILAKDLHEFLDRLNDVPEFTDEAVNASITAFEDDLKYRASCLREFEGQLRFVAVARYINDLSEDLGDHMDRMKDSLDTFIEVGVPTIRFSQKHTATGLQNLSTVATFFSGVTATTLQFSFEDNSTALGSLVNGLWISSLVFSIASAINSQLAYHWRAAQYRSPRAYVPWWVAIWITRTPLFFLVGSVIAFSTGLCLFTYSSHQTAAVSVVITTFTIVTSSALLCVGLWFASERWTFARTKGKRWLLDILEEHSEKAGKVTGVTPAKRAASLGIQHTKSFVGDVKRSMTNTSRRVTGVTGRMTEAMTSLVHLPRTLVERSMSAISVIADGVNGSDHRDEESQEETVRTDSPTHMFGTDNGSGSLAIGGNPEKRKLSDMGKSGEVTIDEERPLVVNTLTPILMASPPSASSRGLDDGSALATTPVSAPETLEPPRPANAGKFKATVKRAMNAIRLAQPPQLGREPIRSMSSPSFTESRHRRDSSEHTLNPSRMQTLVPMLRTLRPSQWLGEHVALVRHLQFSPDGQFLATCSWDKTALIWKVGSGPNDGFELHHKLVHTSRIGGLVGQVAWSPSGDQLLTRQIRTVKVWDPKTGVCNRNIDRKRNVQSVTWLPKGSGFVSVEWRMEAKSPHAEKRPHHTENIVGSDLVVLSADGTVKEEHQLNRLQVWDAVVTPNEERVVAVATLVISQGNLKPVRSRSEKRILVYNLKTKEIENQVPLLQEVRDVTLTEHGNYALVSYENKAPPQAWRIDMINREQKCRLVLAHTYFTKHPVDFAGPSYFGGVNDTFVLCASKGGEIYIWERASGILLHSLKAPDQELTNIAWNHKSPSGFMFASAAHDGIVRIWTTTAPPPRSLASSPEPAVEPDSPSPIRQEFIRPGSPPMASPGPINPGSP